MPTISNVRWGTASSSNGGNVSPGLPTGLASGDIMIAFFHSRENVDGTVSVSGWTEIVNTRTSGGLLACWYKVWQSGDVNPPISIGNHSTGTTGDTINTRVMAYSGGNTSNPIAATGTVSTNASQQNIGPIANAGTLGAEDTIVVFGGKRDDYTTVDLLTGESLTWVSGAQVDSTSGADAGMVVNYAINTGASVSIADKTFTVNGGANADGMGVMFYLNGTDVTGTSAQTLADFTSSASGSVTSVTEGTVAVTLEAFTSSASGVEVFTGTSAQTLADFTSDATGSQVSGATGSAAVTLENATSSASGTETISGTSAQTLADFTSSASAVQTISGSSSSTIESFSSTASGSVIENVTGTASPSVAAFTSNGSALVVISGQSTQTLSDFTSSASGQSVESISGTVAETLDDFTSSASGVETISGQSSQTLDSFTSSTGGLVLIEGGLSETLDSFTSDASGATFINITGEVAATLEAFTSNASGLQTQDVTGTVNTTLQSFTSTASGRGSASALYISGSRILYKSGSKLIDLSTGEVFFGSA